MQRGLLTFAFVVLAAGSAAAQNAQDAVPASLETAQHLFYSGSYEAASAMALALRQSDPESLATFELRGSALHFQLRRLMGNDEDKEKAYKRCGGCPPILELFLDETKSGRQIAQARLEARPNDPETLFYLGKIDLNYIWLRLSTLGQRTGWNEYWEARHSLDDVLKAQPNHLRGRVARAWIDYIVDTKVTWAFRWVLGGGNKKKALAIMREVADPAAEDFARIEAAFGLWDMEVREKNIPAAVAVARALSRKFPENQELTKFLAAH